MIDIYILKLKTKHPRFSAASITKEFCSEIGARNGLDTDLSGDGLPEVVFASYSTDMGKGALYILDAGGNLKHKLALPRRGAMPVPTLADVNGDGTVEILVSLKDAQDKVESVLVYSVPGSSTNCLPWPTGRGNLLRNGMGPATAP